MPTFCRVWLLTWGLLSVAHATAPVPGLLDPSALDRGAKPCENFYRFACGGWVDRFKLPPDKPSYLRQAGPLVDQVEEQLNELLAKLTGKATTPNEKKLSDYYRSCLDQKSSDRLGLSDLKTRLTKIQPPAGRPELAALLAELHLAGVDALFDFYGDSDLKDSNHVIAFLDRGGISLPDRDYYLNRDAKSREVRNRYRAHIARSLVLVGQTAAAAKKAAIFIVAFETQLAAKMLSKNEVRDVQNKFHPKSFAEIKQLVPQVDWDSYLKALGLTVPEKWNAGEPEFLKAMGTLVASTTPSELIGYLKYKLVHRAAQHVGGALQREDFGFWNRYLKGQKQIPPRWKVCTRSVANKMGEALGEAYVASRPTAGTIREKTGEMLGEIRDEFEKRLPQLEWMDEPTRENAKKKLKKMGGKLGWPAKWRDYSPLSIQTDSYLQNDWRATEFEQRRLLNKIGKPTDRDEWYMAVWEPNAYYAASNNEIVLPLGELVPPVFDPQFSDGANFGSLGGGTIGHELTHGFDDSGKDIDADGNFETWWTPSVKKRFEEKGACFVAQAERYEIVPGSSLRIRGKATLGENLADNGGVRLGLLALKQRIKKREMAPPFQGFTELQQYFLGYAQGWCEKVSQEKLRDTLLSDFHPPAEFRVNAVLANQPEFAEAFQCLPGTRMAPSDRCAIW